MSDWKHLTTHGLTVNIKVDDIIEDDLFQMRAGGTDDVIATRYANIMASNDPDGWKGFPDIIVLYVVDEGEIDQGRYGKYYVIGGFHRLAAIKNRGYTDISATVIQGSLADGIAFAAGENADKSLRRMQEDIKRAVATCLWNPDINSWSNAEIARICQVDPQTIANHEKRIRAEHPDYTRPEKLKFIDKYGGVAQRKFSIPKFEVEPAEVDETEGLEREQLLSDIADHHVTAVLPFIEAEYPHERDEQSQKLLAKFPNYALYRQRESLDVDELETLKETLNKIDDYVKEARGTVQDEIYHLWFRDAVDLMTDLDDWDYRRMRTESLTVKFPGFADWDDRIHHAYLRLVALRTCLQEMIAYLKEHGDEEFLPKEYFQMAAAQNAAEDTKEKRDLLVKQHIKVTNTAYKALEELMGNPDDLDWYVASELFKQFVGAYNKEQPKADAVAYSDHNLGSWEFENGKAKTWDVPTIEKRIQGWERIAASCVEKPTWVNDFILGACCRMSEITMEFKGFRYSEVHDDFTLKPIIPLSFPEQQAIVQAAIESAQKKLEEIRLTRMNPATPQDLPVIELETKSSSFGNYEEKFKSELVGLREEIDDLLDDDIDIQAPGLAKVHELPLDVVKAEIAQAKASRGINVAVLTVEDEIKLSGLRSVLEGLHRIGTLEEQVGDGTRHANLYETTSDKVLALRDIILKDAEF